MKKIEKKQAKIVNIFSGFSFLFFCLSPRNRHEIKVFLGIFRKKKNKE